MTHVKPDNTKSVLLWTYRAFLYDPVEHDDCLGLLLPDHEPKVTTGVPEGALQRANALISSHDRKKRRIEESR